jgi:hypothetical protein
VTAAPFKAAANLPYSINKACPWLSADHNPLPH